MFARYRQAGLSLVELMVSILIGLIILSGVLQVVLTSKQSFVSQDEMAYIQENARYAMDVLARDIQSAGHFGCAGINSRLVLSVSQGAGTQLGGLVGREAVVGFGPLQSVPELDRNDSPEARGRRPREADKPETRSDVLVVRRASAVGVPVVDHLGTTLTTAVAAKPLLENLSEPESGPATVPLAVVAEDCQRVGIFRAQVAGTTLAASGHACEGPLKPTTTSEFICDATCTGCENIGAISASQLYGPGAMAHSYLNHAYYIGRSGNAEPALMRAVLRGDGTLDHQEIALGVDALEVQYGVDVNLNGELSYLDAAAVQNLDPTAVPDPWSRVRAVRLSLNFRSPAPTAQAEDPNFKDRYVRQTVESTVRLRNRT